MDEIYFKKDEPKEDESKAKHTYTVYLTNGRVFQVKATDYSDNEDDTKFLGFYDEDWVVATIKADLVYAILDNAYVSEQSVIVQYEAL